MGVRVQARVPDRFHLTFDAPVTLLLVMAAVVATLLPGAANLLRLDPIGPVALLNPRWYLGVVGHVFAHQGLAHLIGNASMLLLLAPGLEKRLGGRRFCVIVGALIVLTGLSASVVLMFTQRSLIGASGLVFALIFLHSLSGSRPHHDPAGPALGFEGIARPFRCESGCEQRAPQRGLLGNLVGCVWCVAGGTHGASLTA